MKKRTARRGLALGLTLAVAMSILSVPAAAAPPQGTASIVTPDAPQPREVFAGSPSEPFDVTLNNPGVGDGVVPQMVNWVMILPPPDDYTVTAVSADGWEGESFPDGRVIFSGGALEGGSSVTFHIEANVGRPDVDVALPWRVLASDDGGETATQYLAASDGALTPIIRVLDVVDNRFTGPDLILDGDATEGQTVFGTTTVSNLGSGTLTVRPELSGTGFTVTTPPDAVTIGPEQTTEVPWTVMIGEPGSAQVTATATADEGAEAPVPASTDVLQVLSQAVLQVIVDTVSPQVAVPGTAVEFQVQLENTGQVRADFDLSQSRLEFAGGAFSAPLVSPTNIDGATGSLFVFDETTISLAISDGDYQATVTLVGVDQNGVAVSQVLNIPELITIDREVPVVDVEVGLPGTDTTVKGESRAATSGVVFDVAGTVEDAGVLCGTCEVAGTIQEFDADGNPLLDPPVSVTVTNDGGNLSASINRQFTDGAVAAQVSVSAVDPAGLVGGGQTALIEVDIVVPTATVATTGGPDGRDTQRIDISLTERVFLPNGLSDTVRPGDFSVSGNIVTAVALEDSRDINENDDGRPVGDRIVLTLQDELGEDDAPDVSFAPSAVSDRPADRVRLEMPNFDLVAVDGIIPRLPEIEVVSGLGRLDGQFFTNDATPDVTVVTVTQDHSVQIWEDDNANGLIDGQDRLVGQATVTEPGTVTITLDNLGQVDRTLSLLTRAIDVAGNVGPVSNDVLTLDFTAPEFSAFAVDGRDVIVSFNESLRGGRNFVADWTVETRKNGRRVFLAHVNVSGDDNTHTRTIEISEDDDQFDGSVSRVTYIFTGSDPAQRYFDRAGNVLVDFTGV